MTKLAVRKKYSTFRKENLYRYVEKRCRSGLFRSRQTVKVSEEFLDASKETAMIGFERKTNLSPILFRFRTFKLATDFALLFGF